MPPGRPRLDLEPFKDEIIEAFNRRETVESMLKGLAAKGYEINGKTFQRRLREWGLYRYSKTPNKKNGRNSTAATSAAAGQSSFSARASTSAAEESTAQSATQARAPSVTTPVTIPPFLQPITQHGDIPGSEDEDDDDDGGDSSASILSADSSPKAPRNNSSIFNTYLERLKPLSRSSAPRPHLHMSQRVWTRQHPAGFGLEMSLAAIRDPAAAPIPIPSPPRDVEVIQQECDSFTFQSFTYEDAFELGHLLHARLLPFALVNKKPTVISIALANSQQVLFQTAVGSGSLPDNETWVQRKRNAVLRWGCSTWLLHNKLGGDEQLFASKFGMSTEQAGKYAIHGGGVPIRVQGVEGVLAVVVVSGLKQDEDHGVIVDVIKAHYQ
ncbi:hypothetical protein CORC01_03883 [Colletotrichum orchidophilum]|uniref:DUF967 domain-containing protein n=1 Tax=Colletotrichum orchidophilum TaxID=1209926 RepID=A0A1G4BHD1_9PEZI|nr:uncharacterized protein CORC01_03883 [Colletotrichum orchidophilum]OHF00809.1 hypothetical protein CORC01_03883 [Colletotrichum orchidophilum]